MRWGGASWLICGHRDKAIDASSRAPKAARTLACFRAVAIGMSKRCLTLAQVGRAVALITGDRYWS